MRAQPRAGRIAEIEVEVAAHGIGVDFARDAARPRVAAHRRDREQAALPLSDDGDVAADGLALDILGPCFRRDVGADGLQPLRTANTRTTMSALTVLTAMLLRDGTG